MVLNDRCFLLVFEESIFNDLIFKYDLMDFDIIFWVK